MSLFKNTFFIRPPVEGDRYYSRSEMMDHLNGVGRILLLPNFRAEGEYTIFDFMLVNLASIVVTLSAVMGAAIMVHSMFLYQEGSLETHPIFSGMSHVSRIGFLGYYSFYHSVAVGIFIPFISVYYANIFRLSVDPSKVKLLPGPNALPQKNMTLRDKKKHGRNALIFGFLGSFAGFTVPLMPILFFNLPIFISDSAIYIFVSYCWLVLAHVVAAYLFFASVTYYPKSLEGLFNMDYQSDTNDNLKEK
jgi:hypothetical protein